MKTVMDQLKSKAVFILDRKGYPRDNMIEMKKALRITQKACEEAYEMGLARGCLSGKPCSKSAQEQYPDAETKRADIDYIISGRVRWHAPKSAEAISRANIDD